MPHTGNENQIENIQLVRDNRRKQLRFVFVTDFYRIGDVYMAFSWRNSEAAATASITTSETIIKQLQTTIDP